MEESTNSGAEKKFGNVSGRKLKGPIDPDSDGLVRFAGRSMKVTVDSGSGGTITGRTMKGSADSGAGTPICIFDGNYHILPGGDISEITGRHRDDNKERILTICLTSSCFANLDRLVVTANKDTRKFLLAAVLRGTGNLLRLEDEEGKIWQFGFSYLMAGQCYEFTGGWSSYVKENQLGAGDLVFFQRHCTDYSRLFIGFRRRGDGGTAPRNDAYEPSQSAFLNPTLPATSAKKQELREKLKEVETHSQLRLPEQTITESDTILVISYGDNQDSEETYFISCIVDEVYLRGFTPCKYDLSRTTLTGNQDMLFRSRACIMIISANCACSRECLDEFMSIMGNFQATNVALLPVLFKVSRSSTETAAQPSQVKKWMDAMNELTVLSRHQYVKGDEVMIAKTIVRDVCLFISSETYNNLIGVKLLFESILPLLHCSQSSSPHIVGLWGMAGIGKTTISREIFRTQAMRYDVCYFLPDFHLMCQTKGLSQLRDEFFSKIFGEEKVFIDTCDTKLSFLRNRFLDKKILIVLDGVSSARDAEVLVGGFGWLSGGVTFILTSRNRQVLVQCKAKEIYEIPILSEYESLCLFGQSQKGRVTMMSEIVNYASGIPLALRVLGSYVQKISISDEKENLRRLRQHPPVEIQDAFKKSFNGLHDNEKNIFLDIACFFRGKNKDHVVNILDGCGFFTDLGIYALIDESLISLVDNMLEMLNIFQDTGRFVVCQENNVASKRSRLWDSTDIADVLINNSGTEAIEGIFLDASGLTCELSPTVFERMYRLRLLKLHCPISGSHYKICLPQGLDSLPDELRLLHWERYPLGSLPRNFNPKNLVELNMPYSNVTKLWKGTKNLEKLKRIILSHSLQLVKFPRLSKAINLEHIDLEGCTSLVKVNSSILHHHKLTFLSMKDCSHLRIMPTTVHLESLEVLNLSGCSELESLQDFSPNLKELYLAGTAIREMPSSIGNLTRLITLDLEDCKRLQHLPPEISNLKAMMTLKLSGCSSLKNLPILDALSLQDSERLDTKMTMEEFVPFELHSTIQESTLDPGELSSVEHMVPPYKRRRLKRVIESVILNLRKRKQEKSVSRTTNLAKVQHGSVSPWGNDRSFWGLPPEKVVFSQRPGKFECRSYMRTGDCKDGNSCQFHHPSDREARVPPRQEMHSSRLYRSFERMKKSSESSKSLYLDVVERSPFDYPWSSQSSDELVEASTKKPRKLYVSELIQATSSSKDATASEKTQE